MIIPQLVLSGVVVNFDKLNPLLGHAKKVPIIGELMASKWGYEALVVTQFKDNKYKKHFFEYDKIIANAEFKNVYYFASLENSLNFIHSNFGSSDNQKKKLVEEKLKLIQSELRKEMTLRKISTDKFPALDNMSLSGFDDDTYDETVHFIKILRMIYNNKLKKATQERDKLTKSMTDTEEKSILYEKLRNKNENEIISFILKNNTVRTGLLETKDELIQKIYPIYYAPIPEHALDIRSHFYASSKYFLGSYYDTTYFNVVIIWIMSLILFVALYFDVFRKIVAGFSR